MSNFIVKKATELLHRFFILIQFIYVYHSTLYNFNNFFVFSSNFPQKTFLIHTKMVLLDLLYKKQRHRGF